MDLKRTYLNVLFQIAQGQSDILQETQFVVVPKEPTDIVGLFASDYESAARYVQNFPDCTVTVFFNGNRVVVEGSQLSLFLFGK